MRGLLTSACVVLAAVAALAQQATFKSGTQVVFVPTTVTDAEGRLVPDLEKEDFTILDNGKPQDITVFQDETQPFTAVVMLDFSASMTGNLQLLKQATEQFLLRILKEDKAQVGAFSDKIQFSGTFTNDRDDLIGALNDLQYGNPTRLYDAIDQSIDMVEKVEGRKVVLVFTDGDDTSSRVGFGHVLDRARERDIMVYAIGLESEYFNGARMEQIYPVSLLSHGQALNITSVSYAGQFNIGITGCRDALPSMQRLAVYMGEALEELEDLLGRKEEAQPRPVATKTARKRAKRAA